MNKKYSFIFAVLVLGGIAYFAFQPQINKLIPINQPYYPPGTYTITYPATIYDYNATVTIAWPSIAFTRIITYHYNCKASVGWFEGTQVDGGVTDTIIGTWTTGKDNFGGIGFSEIETVNGTDTNYNTATNWNLTPIIDPDNVIDPIHSKILVDVPVGFRWITYSNERVFGTISMNGTDHMNISLKMIYYGHKTITGNITGTVVVIDAKYDTIITVVK